MPDGMQWDLRFQALGPLNSFPQLRNYTMEDRYDPSYHCECRRRSDPTCLLDVTLEGRGVFKDGDGEHEMTPGKAFLCVLNDPAVSYYYPEDGKGRWRFLWICFSGGSSEAMLKELIGRHGPVCEMPLDSGYVKSVLSLQSSSQGLESVSPAASAKMTMDLLSAAEAAMLSKRNPESGKDELVSKAQRIALEALESGVSVSSVAKALGVSREHLSRVFHERTAIPFASWLLKQRVLRASRLLRDPRLSCKELAWRLGYGSPANFSRAFLKETGMTPAQFRVSGAPLA